MRGEAGPLGRRQRGRGRAVPRRRPSILRSSFCPQPMAFSVVVSARAARLLKSRDQVAATLAMSPKQLARQSRMSICPAWHSPTGRTRRAILFTALAIAAPLAHAQQLPSIESLSQSYVACVQSAFVHLCVPKTSSVLIARPNRLNVSGDDRALLALPGPHRLAVQVKEPTCGRERGTPTSTDCAAAEGARSRPAHEWGSLVLGPAISMVSIDPPGHHDHPAGDPCALAPSRLPAILAVENPPPSWSPPSRPGPARADPADER